MKNGLDWMPLDVYSDSKWELIEAEYGLTGFAVVVKLLQKTYAENGYYLDWSDDAVMLFSKKAALDADTVRHITEAAIRRGFFDKDCYTRYHILTSVDIQKQYFNAVSRRKEIQVKPEFLLISPSRYCKNAKIHSNDETVDNFDENADSSQQSRAEDRIEKESTAEETASTAAPSKDILSKQYGDELVNTYLLKATRYHYTGTHALIKTAEWLAADTACGKLTLIQKRPTSFDLDEYEAAVNAYTPVYLPDKQKKNNRPLTDI